MFCFLATSHDDKGAVPPAATVRSRDNLLNRPAVHCPARAGRGTPADVRNVIPAFPLLQNYKIIVSIAVLNNYFRAMNGPHVRSRLQVVGHLVASHRHPLGIEITIHSPIQTAKLYRIFRLQPPNLAEFFGLTPRNKHLL